MAGFLTNFFIILIGIIAVLAAVAYFVGIPAEWKEELQKQLMTRAAESQAKDMLSDQLGKLPEADRNQVEGLSSGLQKLSGGKADVRNPLGGLMGGKDE